jgi:hypothetical protein
MEKKLTDEELNELIKKLEYQSWAQNFFELSQAAYMLKQQKAEIERLTDEKNDLIEARRFDSEVYVDLVVERNELQKQVDELKIYLASEKICSKQAVKDTAMEVYSAVLEFCPVHNDGSYSEFIKLFEEWLKHKYGVEVE